MEGHELKAIRQELGLNTTQLARALGYGGADDSASVTIRRYEAGTRPIPPLVERLVYMFAWFGVPKHWIKTCEPQTPLDIVDNVSIARRFSPPSRW
jgi:transcriptional regulator with XRE-family HTH domain